MNYKFRKPSFFRFNFQLAPMPFNDVITQAQTKSRSLPGGLCGEEGLKDFIQYFLWNSFAIIANPNFNAPAPIP